MIQPDAVAALGALAQTTRLTVFRLLVQAGTNGLSAGEIAKAADATAPTMSHHLAILERAGLITALRRGRTVIYAAHYEGIRKLLDFLTDDCCAGRPEICGTGLASPLCTPARDIA